jgi:hypothetical protein
MKFEKVLNLFTYSFQNLLSHLFQVLSLLNFFFNNIPSSFELPLLIIRMLLYYNNHDKM